MDWEIVTWGLLIGIAGMVWLMVLATWSEEPVRTRTAKAHFDAEGVDEPVAQEPKTGPPLVERRSHAA